MGNHQSRRLRPTQKDIAKALGVAQSTVATALSPKSRHKLTPEIVAHILAQAEKMGYRPQRFAQIMQGGRSRAIGIVTSGAGHGTSDVAIQHMAHRLHQRGCHVVRIDTETFAGDTIAIRNQLLDHLVECVVLCNVGRNFGGLFLEEFSQRQIPVIGFRAAFDEGVFAVRHDVRKAFSDLTRLHLALGSRSLCLSLTYRNPNFPKITPAWSNTERALGFYEAIREAGGTVIAEPDAAKALLLPKEGVKHSRTKKDSTSLVGQLFHPIESPLIQDAYEAGYFRVQSFKEAGALPDSVLCSNDDMALGALAACTDFRIGVPNDLRISGCDDKAIARFASVPLTTIRQPNEQMADYVTQVIIDVMADEPKPTEIGLHKFPCDIIVGNSIATAAELDELWRTSFIEQNDCAHFQRLGERQTRFVPLLNSET